MANSRKVLLLFGDSKKVTSLAPAGSDPDVLVIREAAKKLFFDGGSGKIIVQEYCEDFEDWIDVEEDFVAKDKQKLKIVSVVLIPDSHTRQFYVLSHATNATIMLFVFSSCNHRLHHVLLLLLTLVVHLEHS